METQVHVENIRCGGCANTITRKLLEEDGITAVDVNVEQQIVTIQSELEIKDKAVETLLGLGYPQAGSVEGIDSLKGKARSVLSCAVGKIDNVRK